MEMESYMDDLLNFSVTDDEEYDEETDDARPPRNITRRKTGLRQTDTFGLFSPTDPEVVEEEDLEWISNKDAFPVIETFVVELPPPIHFQEPTETKQLSPNSVLTTSSNNSIMTTTTTTSNSSGGSNSTTLVSCCVGLKVPVKARSKRRRTVRSDLKGFWVGNEEERPLKKKTAAVVMGRKCQHCGVDKTPQWRAGPMGPKTLCNACGVRYKSGRLVPEYRPANSPTFSAVLHSNSHRKIVEMRKQQMHSDDRKIVDNSG